MLEVSNLTAIRDERVLFENLQFEIKPGELVQIEGRNGTGKTTLLRIVTGLGDREEGIIKWKGEEVEKSRDVFHQDFWVFELENRLKLHDSPVVVTDVRFPNEIAAIRKFGGICVWVKRGPLPEWYDCALRENTTPEDRQWLLEDAGQLMPQRYPRIHHSEWAWIGQTFNYELDNNGTVENLYQQLNNLLLTDLVSK